MTSFGSFAQKQGGAEYQKKGVGKGFHAGSDPEHKKGVHAEGDCSGDSKGNRSGKGWKVKHYKYGSDGEKHTEDCCGL